MTISLRALVLALALVPVANAPAHAVDVVHILGTGTISPGLPTSGCANQNVSFSSTATIAAGDHTGTYSFGFNGNENCSTLQASHGEGVANGDVVGNLVYDRTGSVLHLFGPAVRFGAAAPQPFRAACLWIPTSSNPVTSYALDCTGVAGISISCGPPACLPAR